MVTSRNSLGCRYPRELAQPKPANVRRILVLGDSFIEGNYYQDTVAARLEAALNQSSPRLRFEVVNCGCSSYSPILHYIRLKHQFLALHPDAIILDIDLTDVFDDYWRYRPRARFAPDGEPLAVSRARWSVRAKDWLVYRSYLVRVIDVVRLRFKGRWKPAGDTRNPAAPTESNAFAYFATMPVGSEDWTREVGFTLANVDRTIELAKRSRVALTITTHPHKQQLRPDAQGKLWNRELEFRLRALCVERGVAFFSAHDDLARAFHAGQPVFFENDMHFSPEGERIWADALANYVVPRLRTASEPAH